MTWEKFALKILCDCGMFEIDAKAVVTFAMEHEQFKAMNRWTTLIDDCPNAMRLTFALKLIFVALQWTALNAAIEPDLVQLMTGRPAQVKAPTGEGP